jgi:hypothetical protein
LAFALHQAKREKIKTKRGKEGPLGGAEDNFRSGFVGYGGFCKTAIDMYGK